MPQLKLSYCQEDSIGKLKFHFADYKLVFDPIKIDTISLQPFFLYAGVVAMLKPIHGKPRRDRLLIWRLEDRGRTGIFKL